MQQMQKSSAAISNPWLISPSHNGLVSIGTHNLHLQATGPVRKANDPVTIVVQGLSANISSWAAVSRLLSPHIRTYTYSRSGFTPSEPSPLPPTSENIALELDLLLEAAGIEPPYVLVAHSWGAVLAREFIAMRKKQNIFGVVFVEANQERTLEVLDWRPFTLWCAATGLDFMKVLNLEKKRKLSDQEWDGFLRDAGDERNKMQGEKEWDEYEGSFEILRKKGGLKTGMLNCPVSIIKAQNGRALKKLYDAVVEGGAGNEEDRQKYAELLKTFDEKDLELQSKLKKLSTNSRFVVAENSGHDVQLTEPEAIVGEVRWILAQNGPNSER
jgi:pimeloyl-ACP methyl ester carboxylesterase